LSAVTLVGFAAWFCTVCDVLPGGVRGPLFLGSLACSAAAGPLGLAVSAALDRRGRRWEGGVVGCLAVLAGLPAGGVLLALLGAAVFGPGILRD
jgi:hypothetical protein